MPRTKPWAQHVGFQIGTELYAAGISVETRVADLAGVAQSIDIGEYIDGLRAGWIHAAQPGVSRDRSSVEDVS